MAEPLALVCWADMQETLITAPPNSGEVEVRGGMFVEQTCRMLFPFVQL